MPYADRSPPKRYDHPRNYEYVMFHVCLTVRQKKFLDVYSAKLGVSMAGMLREGLDLLIAKWMEEGVVEL
jgi:hypothetical protein